MKLEGTLITCMSVVTIFVIFAFSGIMAMGNQKSGKESALSRVYFFSPEDNAFHKISESLSSFSVEDDESTEGAKDVKKQDPKDDLRRFGEKIVLLMDFLREGGSRKETRD